MKSRPRFSAGLLLASFFLLCVALGVARPAAAQRYSILDLGTLGGTESRAYDINNNGHIVGDSVTSLNEPRAFRWVFGSPMQQLFPPANTNFTISRARGINIQGQVTGQVATFGGVEDAVVWSAAGAPTTINGTAFGYGINNNGQVVGDDDGVAFRWTPATGPIRLNEPTDYSGSRAYAINTPGQIVGYMRFVIGSPDRLRAAIWPADAPVNTLGTDLDPLPRQDSNVHTAHSINDRGQIVGWAADASAGFHRAFLYTTNTGMNSLGTLPGSIGSEAYDINAGQQVVGDCQFIDPTVNTRPFLWTAEDGMQDLNSLLPANSGWTLLSARAINDAGQIVGWGSINGQTHAFVMVPTGWAAQSISVGGDNRNRVLWRHAAGTAMLWHVSPTLAIEGVNYYGPYAGFIPLSVATGLDNRSRLLWKHETGGSALWTFSTQGVLETFPFYAPTDGWSPKDVSVGSDGKPRLLWNYIGGANQIWTSSLNGDLESAPVYGPYGGWRAVSIATGSDNRTRLLWRHVEGTALLWTLHPNGTLERFMYYGPYAGWFPKSVSVGPDNRVRMLWSHVGGTAMLWHLSLGDSIESVAYYGPYPDWTVTALATGPDNKNRLLWNSKGGVALLWTLLPNGTFESHAYYGPYN